MQDTTLDQILTATAAARLCNITTRYFLMLKAEGKGPEAHQWGGRKVYMKDEVEAWNKSRRKRQA